MAGSDQFELAMQLHQAGRLAEAEQVFRQILTAEPNHVDALRGLGVIAYQMGQHGVAAELLDRAIQLRPSDPRAYNNLGTLFATSGRLEEAQAAYQRAILVSPTFGEAYSNLANVLSAKGVFDEAKAFYRRAIELDPKYAAAYYNLANTLAKIGESESAVSAYRQAICLQPDSAEAYGNLANVLVTMEQFSEATAAFRQAIRLRPDFAEAHNNFGNLLFATGQFESAVHEFRSAVALRPDLPFVQSNLVFFPMYQPNVTSQDIAAAARNWNDQQAEPLRAQIRPYQNRPDPARRLRVGYVSADFRRHVVGRNVLPLLRDHDSTDFEVLCYSNVTRPDSLTARFRGCAAGWRDIQGASDEQAAEVIRQDGVDILVDLSLHSTGNRLPLFARKPAPVQVTFAGYPGTTGLTTIGYRLSDIYLDPLESDTSVYSEQTFRLPHSFWCYDREGMEIETAPDPGPLPALARGYLTFGCLNNFCKVNEHVLRLWGQVVTAMPGSRFLLMAPERSQRQYVLDRLAESGVNAERVEFATFGPRSNYLAHYRDIDIVLDTFPYNGHTTSLDAFWMGVPIITKIGETVVGRAGWSQLNNLGLPELAAQDETEFLQIAVELASDLSRLSSLRNGMRARMLSSPLMDHISFTRDIETAYRTMWQRWCDT
jgi:predicted O-linked N-acetylglucosamine transferase (SPINDLY family)